jgi:hypothetical protein
MTKNNLPRYYVERETANGIWVPALASYPSVTEAMIAAYKYLPDSIRWRVTPLSGR